MIMNAQMNSQQFSFWHHRYSLYCCCSCARFMIFIEKVFFGRVTTFHDRKWMRWMRATYSPNTRTHFQNCSYTQFEVVAANEARRPSSRHLYGCTTYKARGLWWRDGTGNARSHFYGTARHSAACLGVPFIFFFHNISLTEPTDDDDGKIRSNEKKNEMNERLRERKCCE